MNKVYYKTSEKMKELGDETVDLIVTHPPYLDLENKKYAKLLSTVYSECYRVLRKDKVFVSVNTDVRKKDFYAKHIDIVRIATELGFVLRDEKIWVRTEANRFDRMGYSFILVFSKGDYKKSNKTTRSTLTKYEFEKGIWNLPYSMNVKDFRDAFHPEIPNRFIKAFTEQGELVCDPFMGVGTTMKEASLLGRDFVGYEIDKKLKKLIDG